MCAHVHKRMRQRETERVGWREEGRENSGGEGGRENSQTTYGDIKCQVNSIESVIREDWVAVAEMTAYSSVGT